jgi:nitric oxide synthase oxygenase domain/subunit
MNEERLVESINKIFSKEVSSISIPSDFRSKNDLNQEIEEYKEQLQEPAQKYKESEARKLAWEVASDHIDIINMIYEVGPQSPEQNRLLRQLVFLILLECKWRKANKE